MSRLSRLRTLRPEEIRALVAGVVVLPLVVAGLRIAGFDRMRRWMARGLPPARTGPVELARAETVARMVEVAGRRGIVRATCLPCSLLTWWMVRREGIDAALRIGVSRSGDGLAAHAWVEHRGRPLGADSLASIGFVPFDADLGPAGDPRM